MTLKASDTHGIFNACQTLLALLDNMELTSAPLPNLHITDYPDMEHRGIMLDVARNFTKKADLLKLIDILSFYKMNVLHLHLSDDEAWRVEIPGLEELTEIALVEDILQMNRHVFILRMLGDGMRQILLHWPMDIIHEVTSWIF